MSLQGSAFDHTRSGRLKRLLLRKEREAAKAKKSISKEMTENQKAVLDFVRMFIEKSGYPPTRYEIQEAFGWKSVNAAQQYLEAIAAKGYITLARGVSRGIRITNSAVTVPVAGN